MGPDNEIWVILNILSLHARRTKYLNYVYVVFAPAFSIFDKIFYFTLFLYFCHWHQTYFKQI